MSKSPFLSAYWTNLLNLTYKVPPHLLESHVPPGVELDVQDGNAFASLVAFEFLNTKVKGLKIPFHINFPEINLRFYVKHQGKRGVVFIKELVPKFCIALVARRIYNEPYEAVKMSVNTSKENDHLLLKHHIHYADMDHLIEVKASGALNIPEEDSLVHYFKEHELGFGVTHGGQGLVYKVEHPKWRVYEQVETNLSVDFGKLYGEKWDFLNEAEPYLSCLAEGSDIKVYGAEGL